MTTVDYTHIFEDSLNEIYVFSAETLHFIEVNRGARENLGYTMQELKSLTPLDLKHDHTQETFNSLIAPLHDGSKGKIIFETRHYRKDGTHYPVEVHLHLSNVEDKQVFVAIILDITERIKAKEHAIQLAVEQEHVRLLREFVSDTSHDLRTPLTQVGTSLYLLGRHTDNPKHHDYIARAQDALSRVNKMIDSMLQMSALDSYDNYKMKPVELNQIVEKIIYANKDISRQRKVSLQFLPDGIDVPHVIADEYYLMQAIENILFNALTHTNAGGSVTIKTNIISDYVQVQISDTGPGIAPEHLSKIFDRFYRGDAARGVSNGSNGLGLSIARKIIHKHGGTITVDTVLGEGTTFYVNLPLIQRDDSPELTAQGAVS